ncbi:MAG: DNA polymerase/3'-5' exonuclease PolX [Hyphomicrobium sp.]|uniref:DNA polymerase/3'-5' exonuclease PolX n=1 Tax=Hyphomicrobium sp. TaxID=82 RepID=UPI0013249234|nr:DNA polymerase/3'-5' exonuclease PolX [Hyphomicrobium sp.]KAB2940192.1 MAG: DNA polymerase/3'-5' exonuclease PolX [Hyphomicrobium sp.]MBZ0208133.1 DNA polymerase/3'-5' exonuclease PolX [Hyphomicrobium sp.]
MPIQNAEIAAIFDQTAELLEIQGGNPFRARAYRRAARTIENLPRSVVSLLAAGEELSELPGIGKDLAGKIAKIVSSGRFDVLQALKRKLPGELVAMAELPGLGPKRVKLLYDRMHIRKLEDLRRAAEAGKLSELRGFGEKMEQKILAALSKATRTQKRFKLSEAEAEATSLLDYLHLAAGDIAVAGSFRRRRETVGDLDIVATGRQLDALGDRLVKYESVAEVAAHGPTRTTVILRSGLQVDLRVVPAESFGAALLYFTGSKAHNIALRGLANDRGWKLNEYGLYDGMRRLAGKTEAEVYARLGLDYVPPELREDRGEVDLAREHRLPKLVDTSDIRGDLHAHTNWSDGVASIAEMAAAAKERGYEYLAITDHSRHVTIAHGLDASRLAQQIDEIDRVNETLAGIALLKGTEVDILADGRLDLSNSILSRLDIVVAAVHYKFDLSRKAQTERIIRAMDNPHVNIIAHPTGRLLGKREPHKVDMERLIAAAKERNCCLEINAEPSRLDLNDVHAHAAKAAGLKLAVSTDAHTTHELGYMRYGIDQARRAWLEAGDVVNTRPLAKLKKLLKR